MSTERSPRRTDPRRRHAAAAAREESEGAGEREITLRAMRFHALIGILEHERTVPQPIEVDLTVHSAGAGEILDYRRLYELVERVVTSGPIDYLETVADRITREALADGRIRRTRVAVRKPHVALRGPLAYAEVVLRHRRDDAS
jgi:dihydroneopterin aldolase